MKNNLNLMFIIFGLSIVWWSVFALLMQDAIFLIISLIFIWAIMIVWGLRPRGESRKWDKFRNKIVLVMIIPFYLVSYQKYIGD